SCFFFFFQAEDGIRDSSVTGVQTCALPIFCNFIFSHSLGVKDIPWVEDHKVADKVILPGAAYLEAVMGAGLEVLTQGSGMMMPRSEERRVGKECMCGWMAGG